MLALGHIVKGETVEDLAEQTQMDATKLQASIDGYNQVVAGATEDPFGFKANNTADRQLTEGPWYACRKVPTVHHTMGGIRINVNTEAVSADGEVVPGLYACGECTGGIHGSNRLAVTPLPTASRSDAKPVRRRHSTRQAKPTPPRRTFLTPWPYIPSAVRAIFC